MGSPIHLLDYINSAPTYFLHVGIGPKYPELSTVIKKYPDIEVHGFEPTLTLYDNAIKTYPGKAYNKAIGSECAQVKFYNDGPTSLAWNVRDKEDSYLIECITLDSFCKTNNIKSNVLLWADIEGSELNMLKGCKDLLERKAIDNIVLELWTEIPLDRAESWCKDYEVIEFLEPYGYHIVQETNRESYHSWTGANCNEKGIYTLKKYDAIFGVK